MREPMFQKTQPIDINYRECDTPSGMKRLHYHDGYEIFLQLDGERSLFVGGTECSLSRGSIFIIAPFVLHMTTDAQNPYFKRYLLNLSPLALSSVMTSTESNELFAGLRSCVINLNEREFAETYNCFLQIHRYAEGKSPKSQKLMQMLIALFADFLGITISKHPELTVHADGENASSPISKAVAYINANYRHEIRLDFISDYVHMSKSNFCLIFKKTMGDSFVDYLNAVRVSQAHKLLCSTDMKLVDIAAETGFSSVDYMTRIFKREHGMPPSELKRKSKLPLPRV